MIEMMNRFLLPWAAFFGLFTSTSTCPCCGQPACPAGAAGMGIVAGFLAAVTGFFRRRRCSRLEADSIPGATHAEQRKTKPIVKSGLLMLLCATAFYACAHTAQRQVESKTSGVSLYEGVISFYRGPLNHLQAVRRGECPMYPSCSEYSRQAVARFGFAKGWVMSMDRLMRCGRDEKSTAPRILVHGKLKYFDPIDANDSWHSNLNPSVEATPTKYEGVFHISAHSGSGHPY
jgi:putative component of membrane protein insertase Oxa1/YidC/SpoIIIJ protein YidD